MGQSCLHTIVLEPSRAGSLVVAKPRILTQQSTAWQLDVCSVFEWHVTTLGGRFATRRSSSPVSAFCLGMPNLRPIGPKSGCPALAVPERQVKASEMVNMRIRSFMGSGLSFVWFSSRLEAAVERLRGVVHLLEQNPSNFFGPNKTFSRRDWKNQPISK
jgi:hypothetical protein